MKRYRLLCDAWVYGKFMAKGDEVELWPKQAKYLVMEKTLAEVVPPAK